jgi:two-component system chemotaxis response regulator CheY
MPRILLLEDDAAFRELVAAAMRRGGYEVHTANDGQAGWDMLDAAQPDLILLDLAMPRLDGLSFLRRLRALEQWSAVPVLVVSANSSAASYAVAQGAQGYLIKSRFSMPELLENVSQLTAAAEKRRSSAA